MLTDSKSIFWYVLFAANGKAEKIGDYLQTANIEYFFPMCNTKQRIRNSERTKCTFQPLIRNLVFVKSSKEFLSPHIEKIKQRFSIESGLYYRDLGSREIIIVPEKEMQSFISVAGCKNESIVYLSNEEVNIRKGTRVRITGGVFEGVEGIFMRIQGHKRVVVSIPNLLSVATTFVEPEFILPLE
jgi:transcription antitermination factor NusG